MLNQFIPNTNNIITTNLNLTSITHLLINYFTAFNILNSKPIYNQTVSNCLIITVYYYTNNNNVLTNNSINILSNTIQNILNGISVELRFIQVKYPYIDSYILAKYVALNTNFKTFNNLTKILFESISIVKSIYNTPNHIPVYIIGIQITISGRLITEADRPRQTVQSIRLGSFKKSPHTFIQNESYTLVNAKGTLTVKVSLCQQMNQFKSKSLL